MARFIITDLVTVLAFAENIGQAHERAEELCAYYLPENVVLDPVAGQPIRYLTFFRP